MTDATNAVVATLDAQQTLTNKTLTTPVIASLRNMHQVMILFLLHLPLLLLQMLLLLNLLNHSLKVILC